MKYGVLRKKSFLFVGNRDSVFIFLSLLFPILSFAAQPDIYDQHRAIADQLKEWENHPPLQVAVENEKVVLADFFPGAWITELDEGYSVIYPELFGVLNTSLFYSGYDNDHKFAFRLLLEIKNGKLYTCVGKRAQAGTLGQEQPGRGEGLSLPDSIDTEALQKHLKRQLLYYRTVGIPESYVNHSPVLPDSVTLKLVGRFPEQYRYGSQDWENILNRFCFSLSVYADVMQVNRLDEGKIGVKYILVLVSPGSDKQHLLTINEILKTDNQPSVTEVVARLVPYIRTDNISELYAVPDSSGQDVGKFKINIK